jgi:hypothetical protein
MCHPALVLLELCAPDGLRCQVPPPSTSPSVDFSRHARSASLRARTMVVSLAWPSSLPLTRDSSAAGTSLMPTRTLPDTDPLRRRSELPGSVRSLTTADARRSPQFPVRQRGLRTTSDATLRKNGKPSTRCVAHKAWTAAHKLPEHRLRTDELSSSKPYASPPMRSNLPPIALSNLEGSGNRRK